VPKIAEQLGSNIQWCEFLAQLDQLNETHIGYREVENRKREQMRREQENVSHIPHTDPSPGQDGSIQEQNEAQPSSPQNTVTPSQPHISTTLQAQTDTQPTNLGVPFSPFATTAPRKKPVISDLDQNLYSFKDTLHI